MIATPFVILVLMAIFGFIRLANLEEAKQSSNDNTNQYVYSNLNISPVNLNITIRQDSDFDHLIDYLEERIGTDVTAYDTDLDSYLDGEEVRAGRSPKGRGDFTGAGFLEFCNSTFESTSKLDYSKICGFVADYIEIIRLMAQDESGNSDKDLDQMAEDFCTAHYSDLEICQSAIDVALSLYLQGVTEITNESLESLLNTAVNFNVNTDTSNTSSE